MLERQLLEAQRLVLGDEVVRPAAAVEVTEVDHRGTDLRGDACDDLAAVEIASAETGEGSGSLGVAGGVATAWTVSETRSALGTIVAEAAPSPSTRAMGG